MTIALAQDVEAFVEEQVRAGVCPDVATLVNDVLRSLSENQHRPFATSPELEAWLLEAADSPATSLTPADFDAIRQRVRARLRNPVA
jgi:Arc/MetJ-type ribon-helix-helix transcriptional regulator